MSADSLQCVWEKAGGYPKRSLQAHPLGPCEVCDDMILRTWCARWTEHVHGVEDRDRRCRRELGRQPRQIW